MAQDQPQPWHHTQKGQALLHRIRDNERSLKEVSLSYEGIGDDGARGLAAALDNNTSVHKLWLGGNNIGDDGVAALAGVLQANSTLTHLALWENKITDRGAEALAQVVRHNSAIEGLFLSFNHIEEEGARALAVALVRSSNLQELFLGSNSIGDEGAEALACAVCLNPSLIRLYLDGNRIGERGTRALTTAVRNLGGGGVNQEDVPTFAAGLFDGTAAVQLGLGELGAVQQRLSLNDIGGGQLELQTRPSWEVQPEKAERTGQTKLLEAVIGGGVKKVIRESTQMEAESAPLILERVRATIGIAGVFGIMREQPKLFVPQMASNTK